MFSSTFGLPCSVNHYGFSLAILKQFSDSSKIHTYILKKKKMKEPSLIPRGKEKSCRIFQFWKCLQIPISKLYIFILNGEGLFCNNLRPFKFLSGKLHSDKELSYLLTLQYWSSNTGLSTQCYHISLWSPQSLGTLLKEFRQDTQNTL